MRVISLLASGTEIVCALGAGETLVGRSHECDNPDWVRRLPACTRPAFDTSASSGAIDAEVRRRIKAGEPLYHVDAGLIRDLAPDLLITQVHCDVCAVTPDDVARSGCDLPASRIVTLSASSVSEIFDGIRRVAAVLDRPADGEALIADMRRRMAGHRAEPHRPAPTAVVLEWTDPIFAMGNWGPELVEAAGATPVLGDKAAHSSAIPWSHVVDADPDYLVVAPCGFDLERTLREVPSLEALPGWFDLRAVRCGHVALADGNKYFNRSGTTIVDTVEILAEIVHGSASPRWQGTAWHAYRSAPALK